MTHRSIISMPRSTVATRSNAEPRPVPLKDTESSDRAPTLNQTRSRTGINSGMDGVRGKRTMDDEDDGEAGVGFVGDSADVGVAGMILCPDGDRAIDETSDSAVCIAAAAAAAAACFCNPSIQLHTRCPAKAGRDSSGNFRSETNENGVEGLGEAGAL